MLSDSLSIQLDSSSATFFPTNAGLDANMASVSLLDPTNVNIFRSSSFSATNLPDGIFTVGRSGQVELDYILDGGAFEGELAVFSLSGLNNTLSANDVIQEAARRALSNSELGYIAISDHTEAAKFYGSFPGDRQDWNTGIYQGIKTLNLRPGDQFGLMLVPNGTVQEVLSDPSKIGDRRPLLSFSLDSANPTQFADLTGDDSFFAFEDLALKTGSDRDYNDLSFQIIGATGTAATLDDLKIKHNQDWQKTSLGKEVQEYVETRLLQETISLQDISSGVFTVDATGQVGIDYLFDGGGYNGQLAIFSLEGLDQHDWKVVDFIQEAARRALSDSELGHVVIADRDEGARFSAKLPWEADFNEGIYGGVKTFSMKAGSQFGVMLIPNGTVQEVLNEPTSRGSVRPLFSIASANPRDGFHLGQIADVTGAGNTFTMEDLRFDKGSDRDYNDIVFQVRGAIGQAGLLDDYIDSYKDWRSTDIGQALAEYTKPYVSVSNPTVGESISNELFASIFNLTDKITIEGMTAIAPSDLMTMVNPQVMDSEGIEKLRSLAINSIDSIAQINPSVTSNSRLATLGLPENSQILGNNEISITGNFGNRNSSSGLVNDWFSQLNNELDSLDTDVKKELADRSRTISEITDPVNRQVEDLGKSIAETETSMEGLVESTETQLSSIKNYGSGFVTSTRSQLDMTKKSLNDQINGVEAKLSNGRTQLNSAVGSLRSQQSSDQTLINGKAKEANDKVWSNPMDAFNSQRQQDHVVTVNGRLRFEFGGVKFYEQIPYTGGTPEQKQKIATYTAKIQDDKTEARKAVETAKTEAINSSKKQVDALSQEKDEVIANAEDQLAPLKQAKDTAIQDVENQLTDITSSISDWDKKFADAQEYKTKLFEDINNDFGALQGLKNEVITDAQNRFNTLSSSWDNWVKDTQEQINVWTKITGSNDRWFNPTPTNPALKNGLPLIGVIDTEFSANHPDLDYSRISLGKDWVDGDDNPLMPSSTNQEHGTQILEIIAATRNNGIGMDGINDQSPLWLGRAVGSNNWAQSLIEFVDAVKAANQPNAVVNLSFDLTQINPDGSVTTRYELTPIERAALTYAKRNNILIVTSTGNQGTTMSALAQATQEFDNIFVVGAAEGWQRASYSSYGEVDYANYGKGVDILAQGSASNGASGTSVATAKVTGAASLVWAANPGLNHTQVMDILRRTATDLNTPNWDAQTGMGLLNIPAAVYLAKATQPEVYVPRDFQLVQDTLKAHQISEAYWPQFYEYYYRAALETQFTGSKFDFGQSAWTNSAWSNSVGILATERATKTINGPNHATIKWDAGDSFKREYSWRPDKTSQEDAERQAISRANELRKQLTLPELVYVRYKVTSSDGSSSARVWRGIDTAAKAEYDRKVTELDAAKAFVAKKEQEIKAIQDATQKKINSLSNQIDAKERELRVAINIAQKGQPAYLKELNDRRTSLYRQLNNAPPQRWSELLSAIGRVDKDLKEAQKFDSQSSQTNLIEALRSQLAGLKTQLETTQKEANKLIGGLKSQLEQAKDNLESKTKAVKDLITTAKENLEKEIKEAEAAIEARKGGFFDKLSSSVQQFSKSLGEQIKSTLQGIDVAPVLDALRKIPVVGTVVNGIEGLIALLQGDWITVAKKGINAALDLIPGGSAIPETLVNISVNVGWALVDKKYDQALANTLKDFQVEPTLADTLVGTAWALKDGDWKTALNNGLSKAGFENADKFVQMAWSLKDNQYEQAFKTGLTLTGFDATKVDAFVNISSALKQNKLNQELVTVLTNAKVQDAQRIAQILSNNDPNDDRGALTQAFTSIGFQSADQWAGMVGKVKTGNLFQALSTGFNLIGFNNGQKWVDMAQDLKEQRYDEALATGFQLSSNPDIAKKGGNLAKIATNLRTGDYVDAFYAGLSLVPGLDSLIATFKAIQKTDFKAVAKSLPKAAEALASYF